MKLFIARKDKKLHSLIWMYKPGETGALNEPRGSLLDESEGVAQLNAFISSKDPYFLVSAIYAFGRPLHHREIQLDSSFGFDASKLRRVYSPESFIRKGNLDRYAKGSRNMLASECWFLVAGEGDLSKEKVSAARRALLAFGITDNQELLDYAEKCLNGGLVVVEPVLDWVWLKNMLVLMISLKHSLAKGSMHPLTDCGFRKTSVTRFGAVKQLDSKYDAYVIPIAFNEYWRNKKVLQLVSEAVELYNPFKEEGALSWAPYSKIGFENIEDGFHRIIALKIEDADKGRGIRYVSDNQVDGKPGSAMSFSEDWGGNLYLAITGNIEDERETAQFFFHAIAKSRISCGSIDYDFALDFDRDGGLLARSLDSQLWLTFIGKSGLNVGLCDRCGLPFLVKGKIGKRYCSHNCLQMAKRKDQ